MAFGGYKLKWEKGRFDASASEPYTISRSKIDRFLECPRCYWLEARYGIGRPDTPPFSLNNAVDELLKKEFDAYRAKGERHPLMETYAVPAIPYAHEKIEEWRDALKRGIAFRDVENNLIIRGGIDDVWVNERGELHIVDYKATAGKESVTLDDEWKIQYKRQVEIYQWLFRKNGFDVSPIAYFVYANGLSNKQALAGRLEFDMTILPYEGDDSWIPAVVKNLKTCLVSDAIPAPGTACEYCPYREHAGKKLLALHKRKSS